ncbi:hypothetical protein J3E72DRAFT_268464 [Bipolaris maydis]|nr:hypothetical protein J3E72DRAFT_268464 [Bipolaris maydis]
MRLSSRPSASSPLPPPSSWTHKAGTGPESYGRRGCSALPGTTFTGGIVCRPNWCARATPTRRKYAQQPSVSDYVFRCAPVAPACLHLTCRQYTHAHRKQLSNQTNAVSCRAMLLVKSNKRKLLPACFLCALLIPLFSTAAPNQCWNPVSVPAGRASPSCQPAKVKSLFRAFQTCFAMGRPTRARQRLARTSDLRHPRNHAAIQNTPKPVIESTKAHAFARTAQSLLAWSSAGQARNSEYKLRRGAQLNVLF